MRTKRLRKVGVIDFVLCCRTDRDDVKHLPGVTAAIVLEENFIPGQILRKRAHPLHLRLVNGVASEEQDLEPRICGKEVLYLVRPTISCSNEDVWEHALSDDELGRERLVRHVHDGRRRIVYPNAGREGAESLECPESERERETSVTDQRRGRYVLDELLVRDAILVLLRSGLSRKERREFLVEVYQVLGVLASFKFVLVDRGTSDLINQVALATTYRLQ